MTWNHDIDQAVVQLCHNAPTELVVGREAAAARARFSSNPTLHPQWKTVDRG
ncbi:hypothetical protein [Nocardia sp. SC052]|uniref:hypothetical protein n=1 Tax=Nocardia sichangensis TaxID=3385975 RepID=UPI0039A02E11